MSQKRSLQTLGLKSQKVSWCTNLLIALNQLIYDIDGMSSINKLKFLVLFKLTTFNVATFASPCVPNFCRNDELSSSLSWLFTTRFGVFFYLIFRKQPNPSQNFCYSHFLNFHVSGSTESVSKQPTQLIIAAHNCHKGLKFLCQRIS